MRQVEAPLVMLEPAGISDTAKKTFQIAGFQGWVDASGAWRIEAEVRHSRLRCGTYETGIQLGRGKPGCSRAQWSTGVEYATRLRHCNNATRLHTGNGRFPDLEDRLDQIDCVRVVVRCTGTC